MEHQKRLLLISANRHRSPYPVYPIGLSYLQSYLSAHLSEYETRIFDLNQCSIEALAHELVAFAPRYVGISVRNIDGCNSFDLTSFIPGYQEVADTVRAHFFGSVILGGTGFSIYPEPLFKILKPDYGIVGEGEVALFELIQALDKGTDLSEIEGLVVMKDGRIHQKERSRFLSTLSLNFDEVSTGYYWEHSGMLNMQTKRGCPCRCMYCSYPVIDGRKVRMLETDQVVDNLSRLYRNKGVDYIFFTDSIFNLSTTYNHELCEKIIRSGLKIRWNAYFAPSAIADESMALYKRAGLTHIEFGTDSMCNVQLKNYKKFFDCDDIFRSSELCVKYGVHYAHFLILGGYGETEETLEESFQFSKSLRNTVFFPFVGMRIYPFTELQRQAVREGLIREGDDLVDPVFYLSKDIDVTRLKERASATGKSWIFPDDPRNIVADSFRLKKHLKGPAWEYLTAS